MKYCEKLRANLFGVDMQLGEIEPTPSHMMMCCFITEHTDDTEFIEKQARQLLVAGCQYFAFYGRHKNLWHNAVNSEADDVALTAEYDTMEDFVGNLAERLSERPFVPTDYYLIYDDRNIYEKVVALVNEFKYDIL